MVSVIGARFITAPTTPSAACSVGSPNSKRPTHLGRAFTPKHWFITAMIVRKKCAPAQPERHSVLVLFHADGWIEVFAERHVDVRIEMVPYTGTVSGEVLAEEYLDLTLSPRYRELHLPINCRAADKFRVVRPSDLLRREHELTLLQGLDVFEKSYAPKGEEEVVEWTL